MLKQGFDGVEAVLVIRMVVRMDESYGNEMRVIGLAEMLIASGFV